MKPSIHTWKRRDIGSGARLTIQTPSLVDERGMQQVSVNIPIHAYMRLVQWASMGRTISAAEAECTDSETSLELADLKDALVGIHDAIRTHHLVNDTTEVIEKS